MAWKLRPGTCGQHIENLLPYMARTLTTAVCIYEIVFRDAVTMMLLSAGIQMCGTGDVAHNNVFNSID